MTNTKHNKFGRGGCFRCECCGKLTRDTGQNQPGRYCRKCDEAGEVYNLVQDGVITREQYLERLAAEGNTCPQCVGQ